MKILAFQQNPWAHDAVYANAQAKKHGHRWTRMFIKMFMPRSHSGRRLKIAFGDLFDQIVWDNVSPIIGDHASSNPGPDVIHVRRILKEEQPHVVLAFGRPASETLQRMWNGPLICGPHPAARQAGVMDRLRAMASELRTMIIRCPTPRLNMPGSEPTGSGCKPRVAAYTAANPVRRIKRV